MVTRVAIDAARIAAAVEAAEAGTRAELVCVMARASSSYDVFPLVWAAGLALAAPSVLLSATLWSAEMIYIIQLGLFLVALAVLSLPSLRLRLVPRALKRRTAHRAAAEQFLIRGLSRKADRTGVLLFVSEAERYARIIADEGVAAQIDPVHWNQAIAVLTEHAGAGRVTDGFCAAIALCGEVLAARFPPGDKPTNELSNRFFVI